MKKESKPQVSGIKIKHTAQICLIICVVLLVLTYSGISHVIKNYNNLIENSNNCVEGQKCAISLERSSDYLTDEVRMFVVTREVRHMDNYFGEIASKNRENMVEKLGEIYGKADADAANQLKKALQESNDLEKQEIRAMRLVSMNLGLESGDMPREVSQWQLTAKEKAMTKAEREKKSFDLVYGKEYLESKHTIEKEVQETLSLLENKMQTRQRENGDMLRKTLIQQRFLTFMMMFLVCAILFLVAVLIVHPLAEHIRSIEDNKPWRDIGGYEIRYLADIYNRLYAKNKMYREELIYKAEHDALTGICNREVFQQRQNLLKDKDVDIALLLVDIDEFKHVNDSRGHEVGDEALRRVAGVLRGVSLEERYCVARIGGDEFALILMQVTEDSFPQIDEEIEKLNEMFKNGDAILPPLSVSAGVAFSHNGFTSDLFHKADRALYYTKHHGRRGCSLYNENME